MKWKSYLEQLESWPTTGRHILGQFDAETIIVYQAYRESIGRFAIRNQFFGGDFSYSRMSWIKTNFLWMMYRSGWGAKPDQEVVLAVRIKRAGFDKMLRAAVHSTFVPEIYKTTVDWKAEGSASDVRLQWDPDHAPSGGKQNRRAIQLGLRGDTLRCYGSDWIVAIENVSELAREQWKLVEAGRVEKLITPEESVYPVSDDSVATKLGIEIDQQV